MDHVTTADKAIQFEVNQAWLNPHNFGAENPITKFDLVHLNYHRGLHSQWTPEQIACFPDLKFVITFHDTYEYQPDNLPWELLACPNVRAMVVHEPCDLERDTKVHYWRQAVPQRTGLVAPHPDVFAGGWRPTLGTLGWDFPWKNYDMLAKVTGELGWNLRIVGSVAEPREAQLMELNPRIYFDGFVDAAMAVSCLESCDATAFLYTCANSGTSGAIRLGIAAGRPLLALRTCRQMRDLLQGDAITWLDTLDELAPALLRVRLGYDLRLIELAHRHSWLRAGGQYAALYREIAGTL